MVSGQDLTRLIRDHVHSKTSLQLLNFPDFKPQEAPKDRKIAPNSSLGKTTESKDCRTFSTTDDYVSTENSSLGTSTIQIYTMFLPEPGPPRHLRAS